MSWSAGRTVADAIGAPENLTRFGPKDFSQIPAVHDITAHDTVELWYEHKLH